MPAFLCETCGSQFTPSHEPPPECPICQDERQFVPPGGQKWTTLDALARRHFNSYRQHEPGLIGIGTVPKFSIGQRALLLRTPGGNILWDCIPFIDAATVEIVKGLGGVAAIAISASASTIPRWWREPRLRRGLRFTCTPPTGNGSCGRTRRHAVGRRYLAACSRRNAGALRRPLRRRNGAALGGRRGRRGALLSGDVVQLIPDRTHVSFMRSYPNIIPLSAPAVARIGAMLEPFSFDVIYGAFFDRVIPRAGKDAVKRSVARYIAIVTGDGTAICCERRRDCASSGAVEQRRKPMPSCAHHRPAATLGDRCLPRRFWRGVAVGDGLCPDRYLYRPRRAGA